jgi:uncharacterized protein
MLRKFTGRGLIVAIRAYRLLLSPYFGQHCRFHPTCSAYAIEAIEVHGPWRGGWLALKRIGRCHPLNEGGVDWVPEAHHGSPSSSFHSMSVRDSGATR